MDPSVQTFYFLTLSLIRLAATAVFIDSYQKENDETKKDRFMIFTFGWGVAAVSALFNIIAGDIGVDPLLNTFYFMSRISTSIGTLLIVLGAISYFVNFSFRQVSAGGTLAILVIELSSLVISLETVALVANLLQLFLLFGSYSLGIYYRNRFLAIVHSHSTYYWFLTIVGLAVLSILFFLFVPLAEYVFVSYAFSITLSVLMVIFFIYIEVAIQSHGKFVLKDTYSHDLGNQIQYLLSVAELAKSQLDKVPSNQIRDYLNELEDRCVQAGNLIQNIRQI
ncbi:MAG: hypothetical protein ACFFFG_06200 [Candidatus Thorarchaeota archaeon]